VLSKYPLHHHRGRTLARLEHVGDGDEHGLRRAECTRQTHGRVWSYDHPEHVPLGGSGGLAVTENRPNATHRQHPGRARRTPFLKRDAARPRDGMSAGDRLTPSKTLAQLRTRGQQPLVPNARDARQLAVPQQMCAVLQPLSTRAPCSTQLGPDRLRLATRERAAPHETRMVIPQAKHTQPVQLIELGGTQGIHILRRRTHSISPPEVFTYDE
jgi:hypothetical protein